MGTLLLDLSLQVCKALLPRFPRRVKFLQYCKSIARKFSSPQLGHITEPEVWFYSISLSSAPSSPIVTTYSQDTLVPLYGLCIVILKPLRLLTSKANR